VKIQDLSFFVVLVYLLWRRSSRLFVIFGLACLLLAMPLFAFRIFFTAERLTWYAAAFFAVSVFLIIIKKDKVK
jgi:hypothetical protein